MSLEQKPIPPHELPPAVARIVAGADPGKMMAARGIAPLRPGELAIALYQLTFDAADAVKAAAEAGPTSLPDKILAAALTEALPPVVLHHFAERLPPGRTEVVEKLLYNRALDDQTFVVLAKKLEERELEIIFQNEERLLRCPAIIEALYFNKKARMSSVNRAIELAVRHGIVLEAIPAYDEIARSIGADPDATTEVADQVFDAALAAADEVGDAPADEPPPLSLDGQPAPVPATAQEDKKKSATIDFTKLKLHEKIRLATLGNAYCRSVLIRDSNKMVALAAIRSPQVTDMEVARASGNRALSEDVIRYIANQRDWIKMYPVKLNLVTNPKCPIAISLRLLSFLHPEDLKKLSRSKNVPTALSTTARKLVQARGIE